MSKDKIILEGIFTEIDIKNGGRYYSLEDYLPHIEDLKKRMKYKSDDEKNDGSKTI